MLPEKRVNSVSITDYSSALLAMIDPVAVGISESRRNVLADSDGVNVFTPDTRVLQLTDVLSKTIRAPKQCQTLVAYMSMHQ
jgi:hypothetical protein